MQVILKVDRCKNNQIDISIYKHTENLFEYKYIETHNTVDGMIKYEAKNMAKLRILPTEMRSSKNTKWYEINNYNKMNFFTDLAEHYKDSIKPFDYFIRDVEKMQDNSWNQMTCYIIS